MSRDPLFSDYAVRKAMNQLGAKPQYPEGGDTFYYRLALHIRNEVEAYILENYFVGNVVPVEQQRSNEVITGMTKKSNLLLDILADPQEENILARSVMLPAEEAQIYVIPAIPTYELNEEGVPTGRVMIFENLSGGEHRWDNMGNMTQEPNRTVVLQKRDGIRLSEGYAEARKESIGGEPHAITVRYLRRTNQSGS